MKIETIVHFVNDKLAGETLMYDQLLIHLDSVVDDINTALNACYPVFSEFTIANTDYPDYKYFPDKWIRKVVIPGAAYKFYVTDEEGLATATTYQYEYQDALFEMTRDFSHKVPPSFQEGHQGYVEHYFEQINMKWGDYFG